MVQVRWGHLNREFSILTQAQSIFLDGHFIIEHTARNRSGCFFNFNGTAGIWRRNTIEDAGGWQHDTLTEDLDLSYRAQLKGWQFIFLPEVDLPGRGAGGHERLQEPAAPLGEGLDPDGEEAAADDPQERPALRGEARGLLPPHQQHGVPVDGAAVGADAAVHGGALPARAVRDAVPGSALLHHRDRQRVRLLRGHPARAGHQGLGAGEVPAVPDEPGHRPGHQQREGGAGGAAQPAVGLRAHAEDGRRGQEGCIK